MLLLSFLLAVVEWVEKHPVTTSIIVAIIGGIVAWVWTALRERVALKITIKPYAFKSELVEGERRMVFIKFRIKVLNHSRVPVSLQDFYLQLPEEIRNVRRSPGKFFPGVSITNGLRMYANNFHLQLEDGTRMKVPITLDSPVLYLSGELTDYFLIKHLMGKKIRFVAIDQHGKEHGTKYYLLKSKKFYKDLFSR